MVIRVEARVAINGNFVFGNTRKKCERVADTLAKAQPHNHITITPVEHPFDTYAEKEFWQQCASS
jgi:hypothetical protein